MEQTITSRDNTLIKYVHKLVKSKSFRYEENLFCAEGLRLCEELAKSLRPIKILYTEKFAEKNTQLLSLCEDKYIIMPHVAQKITNTKNAQGVFCLFEMNAKKINSVQNSAKYVIMENVNDPSNAGAIIRSAAAFGYNGVVLTGECADVYADKALRASMGAVGRIDVIIEDSTQTAIECMRANNIHVYATALDGAQDINTVEIIKDKGVAILLGNEANGLLPQSAELSDSKVYIPMAKTAESLNVSVAAGVFLWNFR